MKKLILFALAIFLCHYSYTQNIEYPVAEKKTVTETFFQIYQVDDGYRWLEEVDSPETLLWLEEQRKISDKYLSKAVNRTDSKTSIDKYGTTDWEFPLVLGEYYFQYAYYSSKMAGIGGELIYFTDAGKDFRVPALFYKNDLNAQSDLLVDPNYISQSDRIRLKNLAISEDSKYLAYQFSRNGSDWAEAKVVNLENGQHLKDHLLDLRFSNLAWSGDGFYYSTYPKTDKFGKAIGQQLYYHKLGTDQSEDELVFKRKNPTIEFTSQVTSDRRFLVIEEENPDHGVRNIFYIDFESEQKSLKPLLMNFKYWLNIRDSHDGKFIATTTYQKDNQYIIEIDPANPGAWKEIVPAYDEANMVSLETFRDRILVEFRTEQNPFLVVYDYQGEILDDYELPPASDIIGMRGNWGDDEILLGFESYTIPPVCIKYNIKTFHTEVVQQTSVAFDWDKIFTEEIRCTTDDGIEIPMTIVHKKGLSLDGSNPTILKAYGGFGASSAPEFNPGIIHFIMDGGVFVFAKIRGGGDKGVEWMEDGMGRKKQNSIYDFISVAEYLIAEGYTNPKKLSATGSSHGGLVVAAAAMQRPELFEAVVPVVAPLDMLRFEEFTVGQFHKDEYGTVTDSTDFTCILAYSPYQNIREDINYPSMLVVTAENDDRVPPFNSYKFVAALQNRQAQQNPVLLKVEEDAGHYGALTKSGILQERADIFGFIMYELMKKKK